MTTAELLALSLGLSLATAALGLGIMTVLERQAGDPVLREKAWAAALYIPALPPLFVGLLVLGPAPVLTGTASSIQAATVSFPTGIEADAASGFLTGTLGDTAAIVVLILATVLTVVRAATLAVRALRLRRLLRATAPATPPLRQMLEKAARRIGAPVPVIRVSHSGSDVMLAGLLNPVLVLPAALANAHECPGTRAVCTHELAHLKRADHRQLWAEEALLTVMAINPLLMSIRSRRAAAREEACDALALAGTKAATRRLYARALIEALKNSMPRNDAPAMTFTSEKRKFAMLRLKAILAPASPAGPRMRQVAVCLGGLFAGIACTGSIAIAAQREPVIVATPYAAADRTPDVEAAARPLIFTAPAKRAAIAEDILSDAVVAPVPVTAPEQTPPTNAGEDANLPSTIRNPTWVQLPMPTFPAEAIAQGVTEASVTLTCRAESDGRLSGCSATSEDPVGQGFGVAAIAAAQDARISPGMIAGAAPGASVTFNMRFRLG